MAFSLSDELKNNFSGYKRSRFRYFQLVDNDGMLDQGAVQDQASSTSLDFKTIVNHINPDEVAIFLFLEKSVTYSKPWVLILYLPESLDEETLSKYKEIGGVLNSELGKVFEKEVHFNSIDDITWSNYSTAPNAAKKTVPNWRSNVNTTTSNTRTPTTNDNTPSWVKNNSGTSSPTQKTFDPKKPWNERELALHELNQMEEDGRNQLMKVATDKPTGWRENNLPLTSGAVSALNSIKSKQVNWVQLTLVNNFTEIDCETSKTISSTTNLSSNIDADRTQFYLYDYNGDIVLIHFIPESGSVKEKMVYNTCKAPLSDTIKSNGISVVKKFDIRDPRDLNDSKLREETSRTTSTAFRVTQNMLRSNVDNSPEGRNVNPVSRFRSQSQSPSQTAYMIMGGNSPSPGQPRKLPKGVVIPPRGAYC